jgi:hypothetical protein
VNITEHSSSLLPSSYTACLGFLVVLAAMSRHSTRKLVLITSAVASVLLFIVSHSTTRKNTVDWQSAIIKDIRQRDLEARLNHSEALWSESVKTRKEMVLWYQKEKEREPEKSRK